MEKTVSVNGTEIRIRRLKWGEKKQLKDEGFDVVVPDPKENNDEMVCRVIQMCVLNPKAMDPLDITDVYGLYEQIISFSFLREDDQKNS